MPRQTLGMTLDRIRPYLPPLLLGGGAFLAVILLAGALFSEISILASVLTVVCAVVVLATTWSLALVLDMIEKTGHVLARVHDLLDTPPETRV